MKNNQCPNLNDTDIRQRMSDCADAVEKELTSILISKGTDYEILRDSMRYSTMAGGKRLRPFLVLEFCRLFGGSVEEAMPFACALELLHTYSLIHDDLPCMDNDVLRRGKPTNHVVYGEATALLAGDALLTLALETAASNDRIDPADALAAVRLLASRAGVDGMVGGQQLDLIGETTQYSEAILRLMQEKKTGCLIEASCLLGVYAAGKRSDRQATEAASAYAAAVGLAFQITDDILNVIGDEKQLGKSVHSDSANHKTTFMTYYSVEEAYKLTERLTTEACRAVEGLEGSETLCELAHWLIDRRG